MRGKIPIIMCIDVEPDGFLIDRNKPLPWRGYEGAYEFFTELRPKLSQVTGAPVHYSWFYRIDPQVAETYGSPDWPITHYSKYVEDFIRNGDEIALHIHAYRWENKINNWVEDFGNQEWVNHCVEMGFDCYRNVLEKNCDSFRFGLCWLNNETLNLVEKLGARFDLTVEPGFEFSEKVFPEDCLGGDIPTYDRVPQSPYRPLKSDFTKPEPNRNEGIWIIPMSTGFITYKFGRLETLRKRLFAPDELGPRPVTLNLARGVNGFRSVMEDLLRSLEKPYLAMVVRSDVCGELNSTPTDPENMKRNMDYIVNHPLASHFVFSTPHEAMTIMGYLNAREAVTAS